VEAFDLRRPAGNHSPPIARLNRQDADGVVSRDRHAPLRPAADPPSVEQHAASTAAALVIAAEDDKGGTEPAVRLTYTVVHSASGEVIARGKSAEEAAREVLLYDACDYELRPEAGGLWRLYTCSSRNRGGTGPMAPTKICVAGDTEAGAWRKIAAAVVARGSERAELEVWSDHRYAARSRGAAPVVNASRQLRGAPKTVPLSGVCIPRRSYTMQVFGRGGKPLS
jgi:hypothetical protein